MPIAHALQWLAVVLLTLAGVMQLARARRMESGVNNKNARLSGALFLFAGAVFALLAVDII